MPDPGQISPPRIILFLLIILVAAATWFIPSGAYEYVDGVPVAGTYHTVAPTPQGVGGVLKAAFSGFYDAVDVCVFILMVGGFLGVVMKTGAIDAGVSNVIRALGGLLLLHPKPHSLHHWKLQSDRKSTSLTAL